MNKNWTQFLVSQGAQIEDGRVMYFGDDPGNALSEKTAALSLTQPSTQSSNHILCDLSHYGLISAVGAEAENFLQNQFCNDVRNISALQSQLNAYCNAKGRILAFFRLFQRDEHYYLRLPQEILEPTLNRLRMFVLMTKITLEDASDKLLRIGFSGPEAEQRLTKLVGPAPTTVDSSSQTNGLTIIRIPGAQPRFEIYGDEAAVKHVWEQLSADAKPVGSGCWELIDISAAIPEISPGTQEAFVPQMVNLQAINALSFKKGCYPGQEIVARMHYLGKLKRCMYVAHTEDGAVPAPGDALFAEGSESGQGVGKVVRAQANPGGGADFLAVIEISSAEQRALHLKDANGPLLKLGELPYIVETPS
jgi:hypothetical protein